MGVDPIDEMDQPPPDDVPLPCPPAVAAETPVPPPELLPTEPWLGFPCWPAAPGVPALVPPPSLPGEPPVDGTDATGEPPWTAGTVDRVGAESLGVSTRTTSTVTGRGLVGATRPRVPELETGCRATERSDRAPAPWPTLGLGADAATARLAVSASGLTSTASGLDGNLRGVAGDAGTSGRALSCPADALSGAVVGGRVTITPTPTATAISAGQVASSSALRPARLGARSPFRESAALPGRSMPDVLRTWKASQVPSGAAATLGCSSKRAPTSPAAGRLAARVPHRLS